MLSLLLVGVKQTTTTVTRCHGDNFMLSLLPVGVK